MGFDATLEVAGRVGRITLTGELDAAVAPLFRARIDDAFAQHVERLVLLADALEYLSSAGLRVLVYAKQKSGAGVTLFIVGARAEVVEPIRQAGFHHSVVLLDAYDATQIEP